MSLRLNGNYGDYLNGYPERKPPESEAIKEAVQRQKAGARESVNGAQRQKAEARKSVNGIWQERRTEEKKEGIAAPKDEYISSEESGGRPSGLYRLGKDEKGNSRVIYDDPAGKAKKKENRPEEAEEGAQKCTANTDRVEREIGLLKEKRQQLEQQISAASGDERKVRELERQLARIDAELSRKDNDTFRKQNAVITG